MHLLLVCLEPHTNQCLNSSCCQLPSKQEDLLGEKDTLRANSNHRTASRSSGARRRHRGGSSDRLWYGILKLIYKTHFTITAYKLPLGQCGVGPGPQHPYLTFLTRYIGLGVHCSK